MDVVGSQTATFTHSYSEAGSYTVGFTVTDDRDQSATTSLSVSVAISLEELIEYLDQWKSGDVSIDELLLKIRNWKT